MLTEIKDIINTDVVINISDDNRTLILKESSPSSKIKNLTIKNIPKKSFAFTLDYQPGGTSNKFFKQLSCYINAASNSGVNKGCDLILLTDEGNDQYRILIFDLKSEKPKKEATKKQLLNSELYVKYLMTLLENHLGINTDNIQYKRAIVTADPRNNPKNRTYQSRAKIPAQVDYKITRVTVSRAKEGSVFFGDL